MKTMRPKRADDSFWKRAAQWGPERRREVIELLENNIALLKAMNGEREEKPAVPRVALN